MSDGMDRVILVGNLGKDPETSRTPMGGKIVSFTFATTDRFRGPDGERNLETNWFHVLAWGQSGDFAERFLRKGGKVLIEGRVRLREYERRGEVKQCQLEVTANRILGLDDNGE